jgi:hypothetical protein
MSVAAESPMLNGSPRIVCWSFFTGAKWCEQEFFAKIPGRQQLRERGDKLQANVGSRPLGYD